MSGVKTGETVSRHAVNAPHNASSPVDSQRLALFVPILAGGGAERVIVNLANLFAAQGLQVDLVVANAEHPDGVLRHLVSSEVRLVDLKASGVFTALPKLVRYLRHESPFALLSTLNHANIIAIWARFLARRPIRVVIRIAAPISQEAKNTNRYIGKLIPTLARLFYRQADCVVAVSRWGAEDLIKTLQLPSHKISVLYNPIDRAKVQNLATAPISHPFFEQKIPLILGIGRLNTQKDFPTLIRAFSMIREQYPCHLMILGEGEERPTLEALVHELGIADWVALPGFIENPYPYMRRAAVMVLSSLFEGFPNVLLEAMACGCSVVSTDCPSGPVEIIADARYGRLVSVGNVQAMAQAILDTLEHPSNPADLQERVQAFAPEIIAEQYLAVLRGSTKS